MNFKKTSAILIAILICSGVAMGQTNRKEIADFISSIYSPRTFTSQQVTDAQIETILACGIKSPSARNLQPWHFTVVKTPAIVKQVLSNAEDGNVLFVVSGPEGGQAASVSFDCGLATENMFIAAQAIGLGSRIYTNPVANANANLKGVLGIPDGYRVIAVLRVGCLDTSVDGISSATPRKDAKEIVNYK